MYLLVLGIQGTNRTEQNLNFAFSNFKTKKSAVCGENSPVFVKMVASKLNTDSVFKSQAIFKWLI